MSNIKLNDGTELVPVSPEKKAIVEKDFEEVMLKHNVVIVPVLIKDLSSIVAGVNIYEKLIPSPFNGEGGEKTEENKTDS